MKFAIFGNTYQAKKSTHAETLFRLLERRNAQLCICREFYNFLTSDLHMTIASAELFDGDDFTADMVISIGGDGTFLKAASRVGKKNIPILGINTGRLGFLADISPEPGCNTVWKGNLPFSGSAHYIHISGSNPDLCPPEMRHNSYNSCVSPYFTRLPLLASRRTS